MRSRVLEQGKPRARSTSRLRLASRLVRALAPRLEAGQELSFDERLVLADFLFDAQLEVPPRSAASGECRRYCVIPGTPKASLCILVWDVVSRDVLNAVPSAVIDSIECSVPGLLRW